MCLSTRQDGVENRDKVYKCMGLYGTLTNKRAKKEKKIPQLGVAPRTTHLQNHLFFFFAMQGCALAEPSGPWCLTFALWQLENLRFFIQIICCAP